MLDDEFRLLFRTFLRQPRLVDAGILQPAIINRLLREHLSRKTDHGSRLWLLCNCEIWYRMYIDNLDAAQVQSMIHNNGMGGVKPITADQYL